MCQSKFQVGKYNLIWNFGPLNEDFGQRYISYWLKFFIWVISGIDVYTYQTFKMYILRSMIMVDVRWSVSLWHTHISKKGTKKFRKGN